LKLHLGWHQQLSGSVDLKEDHHEIPFQNSENLPVKLPELLQRLLRFTGLKGAAGKAMVQECGSLSH